MLLGAQVTRDCAGIWVLRNRMLHFDWSEGVRRPFGDIHANCIAYTVGLIAVDSHRLKKKPAGAAACRCICNFGWFGYVRIKYRFGSYARQFLNAQNVSKQTTDVWFLLGLLGNVVDASTVCFFTFIWHTVNIPASCTSRYSQHVVIFSIYISILTWGSVANIPAPCDIAWHPRKLCRSVWPWNVQWCRMWWRLRHSMWGLPCCWILMWFLWELCGNSGVPNRFHQHDIVRVGGGFSLIVLSIWGALWLLD